MTSDVLAADAGFEPAIRCRRPCVMPLDESAIRSTQPVHAWARRVGMAYLVQLAERTFQLEPPAVLEPAHLLVSRSRRKEEERFDR